MAISALIRVAPLSCENGNGRGWRIVWGGLARVHTALYMAALVAPQFIPIIAAFYGRLCAAGKQRKGALTACMHKLLTILHAMLRQGRSGAFQLSLDIPDNCSLGRALGGACRVREYLVSRACEMLSRRRAYDGFGKLGGTRRLYHSICRWSVHGT